MKSARPRRILAVREESERVRGEAAAPPSAATADNQAQQRERCAQLEQLELQTSLRTAERDRRAPSKLASESEGGGARARSGVATSNAAAPSSVASSSSAAAAVAAAAVAAVESAGRKQHEQRDHAAEYRRMGGREQRSTPRLASHE